MKSSCRLLLLCCLVGVVFVPTPAEARIKLITLPVRERVEIQLDHATATLVEEERIVPLVQGVNQVDFSWANTQIDPSTIVFRVLGTDPNVPQVIGEQPEVNVLSVTYPPGENALVWQVSSSSSTSVAVRISYLIGGLTKGFNYRAIAENDESTLTLSQYIRVQNFAGEAYDDTEIYAGLGDAFLKPIGVNETKQMLVQRFENVPVTKTYTADLHRFGWLDQSQNKLRVPMHYRIENTEELGLGQEALPAGKVRIFQKDSPEPDATTAFLGEDFAKHTPIGNHADLFLGVAQDIVVKRTLESRQDDRLAGNLYDRRVVMKYEIENFKDEPVTLKLAEQIEMLRREFGLHASQPAEWVVGQATTLDDGDLVADETDQNQVTFSVDLPQRDGDEAETVTVLLELVFKNQW
ncbi:hypothetical protein [Algisphaera agarilytica]|uniref:DUF4139 domain-containing protein n=1 Tax=Algisphaera agarilytica TaxID=1385975 RepID=A0A7X0H3H0_9BACT|nr:hypothetical protein [Algisphaera agarilytica]MBB6428540.1 hypothetical protein [Algisphaera agarilytica]